MSAYDAGICYAILFSDYFLYLCHVSTNYEILVQDLENEAFPCAYKHMYAHKYLYLPLFLTKCVSYERKRRKSVQNAGHLACVLWQNSGVTPTSNWGYIQAGSGANLEIRKSFVKTIDVM